MTRPLFVHGFHHLSFNVYDSGSIALEYLGDTTVVRICYWSNLGTANYQDLPQYEVCRSVVYSTVNFPFESCHYP